MEKCNESITKITLTVTPSFTVILSTVISRNKTGVFVFDLLVNCSLFY